MKKNVFYFFSTYVLMSVFILTGQAQTFKPQKFNPAAPKGIKKTASKLSGDLNDLYINHQIKTNNAKAETRPVFNNPGLERLLQIKGDRVLVDLTVKEDNTSVRAELEKAGFKLQAAYGRIMSGSVPVSAIPQLEAITDIKFARAAYKPMHNAGPVTGAFRKGIQEVNGITPVISQGDTAQRSYAARDKYKVNGKGVKVGILSDSYNNLGTADSGVAHGELPGPGNPFGYESPVNVLLDNYFFDGADEGRGMAEIVHDAAPGAELAFRTAFLGQADFAQGILDLARYGCKVITDDIYYYAEPFFQDGIIAQAVDRVKKDGVTYFSAAGNGSRQSYENKYHASDYRYAPLDSLFGDSLGTAHNFSAPGKPPVYFQQVKIPQYGYAIFNFQWDDPFYSASVGGPAAQTDLDIWLLDADGNVVNGSYDPNISSGDPFEIFGHYNSTSSQIFYILITKYSGPDPSNLKYIYYGNAGFGTNTYPIQGIHASTIVGHAKAKGAIATAAAPWYRTPAYGSDTPRVEPFSSVGGVPNYFNANGNRINPVVRKKPDVTAPDGGNTSFFPPAIYYGNQDSRNDSDTFPNFFGTSAAAPHAAAVAALMIEAQKLNTITPDQIKSILEESAIDMNDRYKPGFEKGFDYNTGYGFIQADKAVEVVKYPNVYIKDLDLTALCSDHPDSILNWKITNPNSFSVSAHWLLAGFAQSDNVTVPASGEITFSTKSEYYPLPNVVIIDWKDNLDNSHIDVAYSTGATCNQSIVAARNINKAPSVPVDANQNTVEVFPNPVTKNFKVYLSLNKPQNADLGIFSADGKTLYQKTGVTNKGIIDIDASGYKPGLYILKVRQGEFVKTLKVIKQ